MNVTWWESRTTWGQIYIITKTGIQNPWLVPTHLLLFNEYFRRIRRVKPEEIVTIACLKKNVKCNSRNDVIAICAQGVLRRSSAAKSCQLRTPVHEKYTTHYNLALFCLSALSDLCCCSHSVLGWVVLLSTNETSTLSYQEWSQCC